MPKPRTIAAKGGAADLAGFQKSQASALGLAMPGSANLGAGRPTSTIPDIRLGAGGGNQAGDTLISAAMLQRAKEAAEGTQKQEVAYGSTTTIGTE